MRWLCPGTSTASLRRDTLGVGLSSSFGQCTSYNKDSPSKKLLPVLNPLHGCLDEDGMRTG